MLGDCTNKMLIGMEKFAGGIAILQLFKRLIKKSWSFLNER